LSRFNTRYFYYNQVELHRLFFLSFYLFYLLIYRLVSSVCLFIYSIIDLCIFSSVLFICLLGIDINGKHFVILQGEFIAPEKIQNVYLRSPFIAQVFVYGNTFKVSLRRRLGSSNHGPGNCRRFSRHFNRHAS